METERVNKKLKKMETEEYQKLSEREHILLKSSMYIGNNSIIESKEYILNDKTNKIELKNVIFNPAFLKIVDEIFSNAVDHFHRNGTKVSTINVDIENNFISVKNDGKCIPIRKQNGVYIPTFIFGTLLTSSNYDETQERRWVGTNGLGAKLTNIFSSEFTVETFCFEKNLLFSQTWKNNMEIVEDPIISTVQIEEKSDFTKIRFKPDFTKFPMKEIKNNALEDNLIENDVFEDNKPKDNKPKDNKPEVNQIEGDIVKMLEMKLHETAGINPGLKIVFNKKVISYSSFAKFISLFVEEGTKFIHEKQNNWEYFVAPIADSGTTISYVNSVSTPEGGTHVKFILDQIIKLVKPILTKKLKREITINQIKNNLFIFLNCVVVNPTYGSQTKSKLITKITETFSISNKFINSLASSSLLTIIDSLNRSKDNKILKKSSGKKVNKLTDIQKLEDANNAGTSDSINCTLILTEGDSAKSLAVSGFSEIGRDRYGVFPLKGKPLNVNGLDLTSISKNEEISSVVKILGLEYNKKYIKKEDFKNLRYGKIMLMTDQDQDGSHIKGLIINLFHSLWPSLLKSGFIQQLITPIVKVTLRNKILNFYNMKDYKKWETSTSNSKAYSIKYYKGLGTSTAKEAKEYFNQPKNRYEFIYNENDDKEIEKAFSKEKIEERKAWLIDSMKQNINKNEDEIIALYGLDSINKGNKLNYSEYINNELIHFSITDNLRSLPNLIDGLKNSQRKIMFTCFTKIKKDKKELKVEQLSGLVSAESAYHYGEASLNGTIIHLAHNYVGSNNINLLHPSGQFGTRLNGGSDNASPRYIFTNLSYITRFIYREEDEAILKYRIEENQSIEPEFYIPIIPMILVNGSKGIGTGWSTTIPSFNPKEIINELKQMIINKTDSNFQFIPWFANFKNKIEFQKLNTFLSTGTILINKDEKTALVTELPINLWTSVFRDRLLKYIKEDEVINLKEYSTDQHVCFIIYFSDLLFDQLLNTQNGFFNYLKLTSTIKTSNLVGFDQHNILQVYSNINEIMNDYFKVRLEYYEIRKVHLVTKKKIDILIYKNKARFIQMRVEKTLEIENIEEEIILNTLNKLKFDSDPRSEKENDFDYLLMMTLKSFSKQKILEFLKKKEEEEILLKELEITPIETTWLKELDQLLDAYSKHEKIYKVDDFKLPKIPINNYVKLDYNFKQEKKFKNESVLHLLKDTEFIN